MLRIEIADIIFIAMAINTLKALISPDGGVMNAVQVTVLFNLTCLSSIQNALYLQWIIVYFLYQKL